MNVEKSLQNMGGKTRQKLDSKFKIKNFENYCTNPERTLLKKIYIM